MRRRAVSMPPARRDRRDRGGRDDGFTLVEVVVSLVIFMLVGAGATDGIVSALHAAHASQQHVDAANLAQQDLAQVLTVYRSGILPQDSSYTTGVHDESFVVSQSVAFDDGTGNAASACSTGGVFTVHVSVAQAQSSALLAQTDTVVACAQ